MCRPVWPHSYRRQLTIPIEIRWFYDRYDAIGRCIAEAIHSDDRHCFNVNIVSDDEDIVIIWRMKRRLKKVVKRRKCWVYLYLYFNRSGELVRVVMRELEQNREGFTSFYAGWYNEVQVVLAWINRILPVTEDEVFSNTFYKFNICYLARVCIT